MKRSVSVLALNNCSGLCPHSAQKRARVMEMSAMAKSKQTGIFNEVSFTHECVYSAACVKCWLSAGVVIQLCNSKI